LRSKGNIYNQSKRKSDVYEESLVESPDAPFRSEYDAIMRSLLDGPLDEADLLWALDHIEALIGAELDADPNNQLDGASAASEFDAMRNFISKRIRNVRGQLP
jgi:hypothetical protein